MKKIIENLVVFVATIVIVFLLATMLLPRFGYTLIVIRSGSMEPTIKTGSVLISKKSNNYKKGDVITFKKIGNEIVTHRIIAVSKGGDGLFYKTKGDANNADDMFLTKNANVIGRSVAVLPYAGYGIEFLRSKVGVVVLILIPVAYFIWREVLKIRKEWNRIRKSKEKEGEE